MKQLCVFSLVLLFLFSCQDQNNSFKKNICENYEKPIEDTVFFNSEILTSYVYNDSCSIDSLKFIFKIDERSKIKPY